MFKNKQNNRTKTKLVIVIGLLSLLTITLLILPANFFDKGQSICLSMVLLNKECYGCGMTRAIQHLIHFDFEAAYNFNKISFIVFPLIVFLVLMEIKKLYQKID